MGLLEKIFGNYSEKEIKKITPIVKKIESLAPQYENLSDEELRGKTQEFKDRLAKAKLWTIFCRKHIAVVREAASRPHVLNIASFPLYSFIGRYRDAPGYVLPKCVLVKVKTLVATLPAYLNALEGKGVHVVTVNDYLAQRDQRMDGGSIPFPWSGLLAVSSTAWTTTNVAKLMPATSHTAPTMNLVLTTCVITW